jgi:hypothetical protein
VLGVALSCLSERLSPRSGTGNPAWSVWFELSHSLYILLLKGGVVSDRSADCEKIYAGGLSNYTAQNACAALEWGGAELLAAQTRGLFDLRRVPRRAMNSW